MEEHDMIKKPIGIRLLRGMMIGFGLLLLNLIFVLGPYIGIWGIIVGMVSAGVALAFSGLFMILTTLITLPFALTLPLVFIEHPALIGMSSGLMLGVGGILTLLFIWLSKYIIIGTVKYIKWHVNVIRGDVYEQ